MSSPMRLVLGLFVVWRVLVLQPQEVNGMNPCPKCGNTSVPYPLSTSSSCGHPLYPITCTPLQTLELQAVSFNYTITLINPSSATFVIAPSRFVGDSCRTIDSSLNLTGYFTLNTSMPFFLTPNNTVFLLNGSEFLLSSPILDCAAASPCHKALAVFPQASCRSVLCCSFSVGGSSSFTYGFPINGHLTAYLSVYNLDNNTEASSWNYGLEVGWNIPKEPPCTTQSECGSNSTCFSSSNGSFCLCNNGYYWDPLTGTCPQGGCQGFLCNSYAKITIGLTGAFIPTVVIVIGIVALIYPKQTRGIFTKIVALIRSASTKQKLCASSSLIITHLDLDWLTERPIEYQYASLVLATKSFSNLLGEGGFGAVYKGTLGDAKDDAHVQIAVKVLEVRSKHSKNQLLNEMVSIGRIHHVHVVRLLGFCIEQNHEMLVYEYVINGSLDKWLFHCSDSQYGVLLWEQRYAIAIGIAKGLSYLHEECRHRIVHCDIKPQNILLDEQMRPKIADFGLARLMGREESGVVTLARGTPGYMGPEFWLGGESQLSTKLDVYSYGMVLLELISGQQNFRHCMSFPETAFEAAMGGNFESIMDAKLHISKTSDGECIIYSDGMQRQQVQTALLVALWCIQDLPMNRPFMSEVVQYLEGTAAVNEQPPRPTIACNVFSISAQVQRSYLSSDLDYDMITPQLSGGR